jgi:hypothetical protein
MRQSVSRTPRFCFLLVLITIFAAANAPAQSFQVVHSFTGGSDGSHPQAGVAIGADGNLYTTATGGGSHEGNCSSFGCGVVVKFSRNRSQWKTTPLYIFQGGNDGSLPDAGVIVGANGVLYGTTAAGGDNNGFGFGTVFALLPASYACSSAPCLWNETVLHSFAGGSDGWQPTLGTLVADAAGNLYGTTMVGGSGGCYGGFGCGVVFKLTPSEGGWTESVLFSFTGDSAGAYPQGGLVLDRAGNIYGTATSGGVGNCNAYVGGCGVVFKLSPSPDGWTETVLHSFTGAGDGGVPVGNLVFSPPGVLYGTTEQGGTGNGTVFELIPSQGAWRLATIYVFPGPGIAGPTAGLAVDAHGDLYGTTLSGPPRYPPCSGSVFKLTHSSGAWNYSLMHCFTGGNDGGQPYSPVTLDRSGHMYGTAYSGGSYGEGVVWQIMP